MISPLYTLNEIICFLDTKCLSVNNQPYNYTDKKLATKAISHISIDSRSCQNNSLFICLEDKRDGHDFIQSAIDNGAGVIIGTRSMPEIIKKFPNIDVKKIVYIQVINSFAALSLLAKNARQRSLGYYLSITGSAGKTTCKEILSHCLAKYKDKNNNNASLAFYASPKSFNNELGVRISLANTHILDQYVILECGMNHIGEIEKLNALIIPDMAIITTILPAHIGHFKDIDAIAQAKAEIMNLSESMHEDFIIILPRDNKKFDFLSSYARDKGIKNILSFGEDSLADCVIKSLAYENKQMLVKLLYQGKEYIIRSQLWGLHNAQIIAASFLALKTMFKDAINLFADFQSFLPVVGRGKRHICHRDGKEYMVIDESYNANPGSMLAAITSILQYVKATKKQNNFRAVLGDMKELGKFSQFYHEEIAKLINKSKISRLYLIGDEMKYLRNSLNALTDVEFYDDLQKLEIDLQEQVQNNDIIFIKGSQSCGLASVVETLIN